MGIVKLNYQPTRRNSPGQRRCFSTELGEIATGKGKRAWHKIKRRKSPLAVKHKSQAQLPERRG